MKKVRDVMTTEPACAELDTDIRTVSEMMCSFDCGVIPVTDQKQGGLLVGIVTDRDIVCRSIAQGKNPLKLEVRECMTASPVMITPDTDIDECLRLMEEHQIRRVPVVDQDGRCVGIVSQADIARKAPALVSGEVVKEISMPSQTLAGH